MNNIRKLFVCLAIFALFSIQKQEAASPAQTDSSRYLDQYIDTSVNPGDDFFKYACGKWIKDHPIPSNENSWGIYNVVQEETYNRLQSINKSAAAESHPAKGTSAQKIGDFWYSAMDTATIEKQGISPLKDEFDRINAIQDKQSLLDTAAHLQYIGVSTIFSAYVFQDEMNSNRYALHLYQGGIGLPERDYYFDQDDRTKNIRKEYLIHLSKMFQLLGDSEQNASKNADTVMRMETDLAKASRKLEDLRDPRANYHEMKVDEVSTLTPSIKWRDYLAKGNIRDIDSVIVGQPEFFQQMEKSIDSESIDNWKTYLRWCLINSFADKLSSSFEQQNFHFYSTVLNGTPEMRPRWKRMLDEEENYLGDALGQLYVKQYFSPATKVRYEKLTEDIFQAFRERIQKLDWMSPETKQAALKKLNAVTRKVGYPQKWKDYSNYEVDRDAFVLNCLRGNIWKSNYAIQKLHRPVDRLEWSMEPQTYNAYYNTSNNEIVLPAAIFILPGIPDSEIDDALVYGYSGGTTIGHEITHGFDDQGRQFDEQGNLKEWWTKADEEEFKKRAALIINQYNNYLVLDKVHVNGKATQGENIADLGGILLGWDAFKKTEEYKSGKSVGGYTPAQRYFFGWMLGWVNSIRPENLAVRVKSDVHSPSFLRVNGPVSNMPEFYEAFHIKPGAPMYRPDSERVHIW